MPIYEYKCPKCDKVVEQIEQAGGLYTTPLCVHYTVGTDGQTHYVMERIQFSRPGEPQFSGPGFYKNDYKDKP